MAGRIEAELQAAKCATEMEQHKPNLKGARRQTSAFHDGKGWMSRKLSASGGGRKMFLDIPFYSTRPTAIWQAATRASG